MSLLKKEKVSGRGEKGMDSGLANSHSCLHLELFKNEYKAIKTSLGGKWH